MMISPVRKVGRLYVMDVGTTVAGVGSTRLVADVVAVVVVDSLRRSLHRKVPQHSPQETCGINLKMLPDS